MGVSNLDCSKVTENHVIVMSSNTEDKSFYSVTQSGNVNCLMSHERAEGNYNDSAEYNWD